MWWTPLRWWSCLTLLMGWCIPAALHAQRIPEHLLHCYRTTATNDSSSATVAHNHHNMPHTLQLFIELLRKIEDANPTSLDMLQISANLLHRLRLDGIERASGVRETAHITPFRANGIQVSKYQLLLQLVSDHPARLNFADWLTPAELCHLHRALSASVEPWERGDEQHVCPLNRQSPERIPRPWLKSNHFQDPFSGASTVFAERLSRCPLEGGVLRSRAYGTFAAGTVVASIAAGLQPQAVVLGELLETPEVERIVGNWDGEMDELSSGSSMTMMAAQRRRGRRSTETGSSSSYGRMRSTSDAVDNKYAAGLAGDLAEVCVYQGPYVGENVTVGLEGVWNNTLYPRIRHFPDAGAGRWEFTDAEILAGIDGLFLAQHVSDWRTNVQRLRLSQVLDMFYSSRGIPSRFSTRDELTSACDRHTILQQIDRDQLHVQTFRLAQVLQYRRSSMALAEAQLQANCAATVNRFMAYAEQLLAALPACNQVRQYSARPVVDLTLVLDGSRTEYESLEFVGYVVEAIDVANSGSWISIIHGQTGQYMVQRTRSVATVFEQLQNFTGRFPTSLSISGALQRLHITLANQTRAERQSAVIAAESHVLLIASQKQRITANDFASAHSIMHNTLMQFPDLYFVFVTNARDQIDELVGINSNGGGGGTAPPTVGTRRAAGHYKIIESTAIEAGAFGESMIAYLNLIPKRVVTPFCRNGSRTEYNGVRPDGGGTRFVFHEAYISPYQEHVYRIGPELLPASGDAVVRITFRVNYGKMSVCQARDLARSAISCQSIDESGSALFELEAPCARQQHAACSGVYFFVTLDQTHMRCTETRCRYPDQVLMIMQHEGLLCARDDRSSGASLMASTCWGVVVMAVVFVTSSIWL